jgi:hypothetical protein
MRTMRNLLRLRSSGAQPTVGDPWKSLKRGGHKFTA